MYSTSIILCVLLFYYFEIFTEKLFLFLQIPNNPLEPNLMPLWQVLQVDLTPVLPRLVKAILFFLIPASIFLRFFEEPKCSLFFQAAAVTGSGAKHDCDKEKSKIGHRRVNERGEITFKKVTTNHLMGSIQLGLYNRNLPII